MDDDSATVTLSFLDLPFELQLMIIEHLSPQDLCRSLAPVCKELNALHANPHLWLRLFKQLLASPRLAVTRPPDGDAAFGDDDEEEMALARDEEDEGHARGLLASMAPPSSSPLPQLSIADIADDEGTATKRQPEFGDAWLLHARCIVNQALREGLAIDWKQEFLQRASFSVLIMAHHSAHQAYGSRYDLNLYRQLKKVGIPIVDVCHPDCTEIETLVTQERKCEDAELDPTDRYVPFEWEKIRQYSVIFLFFATAPSAENAIKMGNMLYDFLRDGGGLVMGCYSYLDCNELHGKWSQVLYPMASSDYGSGSKNWEAGKFLGTHIADHPIMIGVKNVAIARDNRCESPLSNGAVAVAHYGDGVPFVVLLDSEANRKNAAAAAAHDESDNDESVRWGSTVYVNLFPVAKSKKESGWYEASTDIPLIFRNALWYVSRKRASGCRSLALPTLPL
jgi:hypothetical protein